MQLVWCYSNPSVLLLPCGELQVMSLLFSCWVSALPSWIAGSHAVVWYCQASPLMPEGWTPESEQQPAKHHRACSSRAGQLGRCGEQQCTEGLKFSPRVANTNLASYAQIFTEVRPLSSWRAGSSTMASLAQNSRSSQLLWFVFLFPLLRTGAEQLSPLPQRPQSQGFPCHCCHERGHLLSPLLQSELCRIPFLAPMNYVASADGREQRPEQPLPPASAAKPERSHKADADGWVGGCAWQQGQE